MARTGWSASNYLLYSGLPGGLSGAPLTMACWVKPTTLSGTSAAYALASLFGAFAHVLYIAYDGTGRVIFRIRAGSGASTVEFATSTLLTGNNWHHVCGVAASSTSRAIFLNGGGKGTDTTNRAPTLASFSAGVVDAGSPMNSADLLAEVGLWNIALSDAEVAKLAAGMSPLKMHPEALVGYWPLLGDASPERNLLSNTSILSVQGSLSAAVHPRIFRE